MDAPQGLQAVTVIAAAALEGVILSSLWMGRQVKNLGKLLVDNPLTRLIPKILACLLVIAAHQLLPFSWHIGFWIGAGGFFVLTGAEYKEEIIAPLAYGSATSWLIYTARSIEMLLRAHTVFAAVSAVGFATISLTSASSWIAWRAEHN